MENTRILVILIVVINNHGIVAISSKASTKKSSKKSKKEGCYKTKRLWCAIMLWCEELLYRNLPTESEAPVAYQIATNAVLRSPILILLKTQKTAQDKEWESIRTGIRRIIRTATPKKIKKLLVVLPKLESKGYTKRKSGNFQVYIICTYVLY